MPALSVATELFRRTLRAVRLNAPTSRGAASVGEGDGLLDGLSEPDVADTLVASLQLCLPAWVSARGIATLLVAHYGGQAVGSALLGWAATATGVRVVLGAAAFVLLAGVSIAAWWPLDPDIADGPPGGPALPEGMS
jgi:hypothetical protein